MRHLAKFLAAASGLAASSAATAQFALVTNQPGTFTDIAGVGQVISTNGTNNNTQAFTSSVTNLLVTSPNLFGSTNGYVTNAVFNENNSEQNTQLPVALATLGFFPFWDYIIGGQWHMASVENGIPVEIIQWNNVYPASGGGGSPHGSIELKIFASGPVLAQYIYQWSNPAFAGGGAGATIGLQWGQTDFIQYSYNTPGSVSSGTVLSIVADGTGGACCLPSGLCAYKNASSCQAAGGTFSGTGTDCSSASCPQPPKGACCLATDQSCINIWQGGCTSQGGVYRGNGSSCSVGGCAWGWSEVREAAEFPEVAQAVAGSGTLPGIAGNLNHEGDVDMYRVRICDAPNFSANLINASTPASLDTQLWLFDESGHGVTADDDDPQDPTGGENRSRLSSQFITAGGTYYLAVTGFNSDPVGEPNPVTGNPVDLIWVNAFYTPGGGAVYNIEHQPDGPCRFEALGAWLHNSSHRGHYYIELTGACYVDPAPAGCYANCDQSTTPPVLNVADFTCFLQRFAAGCP